MNLKVQTDAREKTTRLLFILGILIFTYTFCRAALLSITWDESQSYHEYIKNHIVLLDRYDFMSANNHLLNTIGGIFFTELLGVNEFTLRLTSLVAHIFFLIYSARLVLNLDKKGIVVAAFLILNLNPFLLDFFSLSRGYSISLGMMMASLFYFYHFHKNNFRSRDAVLALLFSMLATLGNLTLLNYAVVLMAMIAVLYIYNYSKQENSIFIALKRTTIAVLLPAAMFALFLAFILPISFHLRGAGALFMGGDQGFWADTIGTVVPRLWYGLDFNPWLLRITKIFFILIFGVAGIYAGIKVFSKQLTANRTFLLSLFLMLSMIILSTMVQHRLLGTLYLIERTVLFLFILLLVLFVFLMDDLAAKDGRFRYLLQTVALLVGVHFLFSFNLKYVYEWKDDCETRDMLNDLAGIKEAPKDKFNLTIGLPLSLESSINYYRGVEHLHWLNEAVRTLKYNNLNDYFFLRPIEMSKTNMDSLEVIKSYPTTGNILAKPKYPFSVRTVLIDSIQAQCSPEKPYAITDSIEFSPGFHFPVKTEWFIRNSLLSCQVAFQTLKAFRANVYFVVTCENKKGVYDWRPLRLNDFCSGESGAAIANFTTFIPEEMKVGDEIRIYLWNPEGQTFLINKMHLKWIHYAQQKK